MKKFEQEIERLKDIIRKERKEKSESDENFAKEIEELKEILRKEREEKKGI